MTLRSFIDHAKARNWAVVALFALAVSACASAPREADPSGVSIAKAELMALQDQWVAAEIAGDAQTLERIFDERFLSTWSSGATVGRREYIDTIVGADIAPFTVVTDSVVVHGDTGLVISRTEDGGTKFTWIAVKRDDAWRVVSQTFSRVSKPE